MKRFLIVLLAAMTALVVYYLYFSESEVKARRVRGQVDLLRIGMTGDSVKILLTSPDTIHYYQDVEKYGPGIQVFQYNQGFGAPDVLRVLIRSDTVVDVISND